MDPFVMYLEDGDYPSVREVVSEALYGKDRGALQVNCTYAW